MYEQLEAYLSFVDAKESTRQTYKKALERFSRFVSDCDSRPEDITFADLLYYKETLQDDNKSAQTINLYLSTVRGFYRWAKGQGICEDVAAGLKSVRVNKDTFRRMHLESYQGARLLEEVSIPQKGKGMTDAITKKLNAKEDIIALRNFAMINLMLRTGLRTIEVHRADIGDITVRKERRILKVWGKGREEKDQFVILTDETYGPILDYLMTRPGARDNEPLFATEGLGHSGGRVSTRTIQDICKKALRAIDLDSHEYSAHSLRHTTGTQILLNGGTMFDVQAVLRHASPATSQLYVNTVQEDVRLQEAKEQLLDASFKDTKK